MPWWGWLIVGLGLLAIEMFVIDAEFYLVFLGISALIVGLFGLGGIALPEWSEWLLFAVLALLTMVAFRRRLYNVVRQRSGHVDQRLNIGDAVTVPSRLEPGQVCRVQHRGSTWEAKNIDTHALDANEEAAIAHVDGLTLQLKRKPPALG